MSKHRKERVKEWAEEMNCYVRLFRLLLQFQPGFLVMGITLLMDSLAPFVGIYLSSMLINALYEGRGGRTILMWALAGAALSLAVSAVRHVAGKYRNVMWWEMKHRMARPVMDKSMKMDYPLTEDEEVRGMRLRQEELDKWKGNVYEVFLRRMEQAGAAFLKLLFGTVTILPLFAMNADGKWMGATVFPVAALAGLGLYARNRVGVWSAEKHKEIHRERNDQNRLNNYMMEQVVLSNEAGKDVRIFHEEKLVEGYGDAMTQNWRDTNMLLLKIDVKRDASSAFLSASLGILSYLYMGLCALFGLISAGSIVRYAGGIQQMIQAIADLLGCRSDLAADRDIVEDYLAFLDVPDIQKKGTIPVEKRKDGRFLIEFRHVSFAYPGTDRYILKDVNLTCEIGGRLALVGPNGSGKTTFIKLLCRLYDPTEGVILLNGVDIRKYAPEEYRRLFAVVFQDFQIFSFRLGEVIAGSCLVEEERAADAVRRAGLEDMVAAMPDGLDTMVNREFDEKGITISGGEAQKTAMARAIYKNAPFVILDEPTAALDPMAEYEIYTHFHEVIGDKTALFISHRLSACRFSQEILVFEAGQIVQRGSHDALLKEPGLYSRMWEAQAKYYR